MKYYFPEIVKLSRYTHIIRKMKLTAICLLLCICAVFAGNTHSQETKVTLRVTNMSIKEAINKIEHSTNYVFVLSDQATAETNKKVDVNIEDMPLSEILDNILAGTQLTYNIIDKQVVIYTDKTKKIKTEETEKITAEIQQPAKIKITGKITDLNGEPLIGANIVEVGTTNGVAADINGSYTLDVLPGATLKISYIGYKPADIKVDNREVINVVLEEDGESLSEVVVVGYGTQKKQTLSGAIASISSQDILTTKTENLINNIQGKIPGLLIRQQTSTPGEFSNMVSIRGYGDPLVVIDGITRTNDGISEMAQLNPDDIESISVLKDASAAIYGMNANNGVIIVTTKRGGEGNAKVSYSGLVGTKMPTGMARTVDAYTYRVMKNEMERNIGVYTPMFSDDILEKYRLGIDGHRDWDWVDMFMKDNAFQQNHTVSVRGGTQRTKYFTSFGYSEDNGLIVNDLQKYRRFNLRANLTTELSKYLTLSVSLSGRWDYTHMAREGFLWTYKNLIVNDRGIGPYTIANPDHLSNIPPEQKNAAALTDASKEGYQSRRNYHTSTIVELNYKAPFLQGLNFTALGSLDTQNGNRSVLQRAYDIYDYFSDNWVATKGQDYYRSTMFLYEKLYFRIMANYQKSWESHNFSLMGALEASQDRNDELDGSRTYTDIFTHDILNQGTSTTAANSGFRSLRRLAAYFGRFNYDYDGKYLLEGVIRYDGSYRYARGKRWSLFPSFSAGWRVSEESFVKNLVPALNNLKLRVSYGESGRDQGAAFNYIAGYTSNGGRGSVFDGESLTAGMIPPALISDQLTWYSSKFWDVGVDFDFWKGKLGGTFDYFQRTNTGLPTSGRIIPLPNTFGTDPPSENLNSDMNLGFDISLTHRGKIQKFTYSVGANVTLARSKRLHVERGPHSSSWDYWRNGAEDRIQGRALIYTYEGQYTSLDQYESAPLMGGTRGNSRMLPGSFRLIDRNGDGIINSNDQAYESWVSGSSAYVSGVGTGQKVNPPLQFGFNLSGAYNGFDLNMLFQGAGMYSMDYGVGDIWGYGNYPTLLEKYMDRWHTVNVTDDPYNPSTQWVPGFYPALRSSRSNTIDGNAIDNQRPNATYLRLKNVELGYTIPRTTIKKIGVENVRLFINGTNLLTFCAKELRDCDPERQEADFNASLAYPIMKAVNFGLNINF